MDIALKLGADYVATGHYCRKQTETINRKPIHKLLAGKDPNKDQSYFFVSAITKTTVKSLIPNW